MLTGELDASLSGLAGYKIDMLHADATYVVFENGAHMPRGWHGSSFPTRKERSRRVAPGREKSCVLNNGAKKGSLRRTRARPN